MRPSGQSAKCSVSTAVASAASEEIFDDSGFGSQAYHTCRGSYVCSNLRRVRVHYAYNAVDTSYAGACVHERTAEREAPQGMGVHLSQ